MMKFNKKLFAERLDEVNNKSDVTFIQHTHAHNYSSHPIYP